MTKIEGDGVAVMGGGMVLVGVTAVVAQLSHPASLIILALAGVVMLAGLVMGFVGAARGI